jgi:hypothetical protein
MTAVGILVGMAAMVVVGVRSWRKQPRRQEDSIMTAIASALVVTGVLLLVVT